MKNMILALALVVTSFGLAEAETISGQLVVSEGSLRVQRDDGFKVHFYEGQYRADLNLIGAGRRGELRIERKEITTRVPFRVPRAVPANGDFSFTADQMEQTFDMRGTVATKTVDSDTYYGYEGCTYYRDEYVCYRDRRGRRVCQWETRAYRGEKEVEYFIRRTTRRLNIVLSSGTDVPFSGRKNWSRKIYTYRGPCR